MSNMLKCEDDCDLLTNEIWEFVDLMDFPLGRWPVAGSVYTEDMWITSFEKKIVVPFFSKHCHECIKKSLNLICKNKCSTSIQLLHRVYSKTIIEAAIEYCAFNFVIKLISYGADTMVRGKKRSIGSYILHECLHNTAIQRFLRKEQKTSYEHDFLKKIIGELTINEFDSIINIFLNNNVDCSRILYPIDSSGRLMFKILLDYGANIYYCIDDYGNTIPTLIKLWFYSFRSYDMDTLACKIFDILSSRYNFYSVNLELNHNIQIKIIHNIIHNIIHCANEKYWVGINGELFKRLTMIHTLKRTLPIPIVEEVIPHIFYDMPK